MSSNVKQNAKEIARIAAQRKAAEITESPAAEITLPQDSNAPSVAYGKPADVDATQLAINEAESRKQLSEHASAPASAPASDTVEKTALEAMLSRLGFKSAVELTSYNGTIGCFVSLKADESIVKRYSALNVGALVGLDTATFKLIFTADRAAIAELNANKAKAVRIAGQSLFAVTRLYRPIATMGTLNQIVECVADDSGAIIALSENRRISVSYFSKDVIKAGKTTTRDMVRATVTFADGTSETIESYWLQGLMQALASRKLAIVVNV